VVVVAVVRREEVVVEVAVVSSLYKFTGSVRDKLLLVTFVVVQDLQS